MPCLALMDLEKGTCPPLERVPTLQQLLCCSLRRLTNASIACNEQILRCWKACRPAVCATMEALHNFLCAKRQLQRMAPRSWVIGSWYA